MCFSLLVKDIEIGEYAKNVESAMSRLMLKSAKRASLVENLRSLRGLAKLRTASAPDFLTILICAFLVHLFRSLHLVARWQMVRHRAMMGLKRPAWSWPPFLLLSPLGRYLPEFHPS
jgi:hypothetical protein